MTAHAGTRCKNGTDEIVMLQNSLVHSLTSKLSDFQYITILLVVKEVTKCLQFSSSSVECRLNLYYIT